MARQSAVRKRNPEAESPRPLRVPEKRAGALDQIIHERMRLGIVSALAANDTLTFSELKKILATTDGNVSVHARKLEAARYIECNKSFAGRKPQTEYRLTPIGRRALEKYLAHMEAIINAMKGE